MGHKNLVWEIAGGIVLAVMVIGAIDSYLLYHVIQAFSSDMDRILGGKGSGMGATAPKQARPVVPVRKPLPPGYHCTGAVLLKREGNAWTQITARDRHYYCPPG